MIVTDFKWEAHDWGSFFIGPNQDDLYIFVFQMVDGEVQGKFEDGWSCAEWLTQIVNEHLATRPA